MKRENGLFERIISIENLHEAFYKASRRKRNSAEYLLFRQNAAENLEQIRQSLIDGTCTLDTYRQFTISDPKLRIISAAPFRDRIIHHAIINVLEPVFERQFIYHTYACRKGKGTHAAASYAFSCARRFKYFAKLDVRKYFDSMSHDVLKADLCRIIKDYRCLSLLFTLIDSYSVGSTENGGGLHGLPIGNLTSQFFANLYLSPLDHYILEKLNPCGYVRYMDDMVLFAESLAHIREMFAAISTFCQERLFLQLKSPVFGLCADGVPFLGWRITDKRVLLLSSTRRRFRAKFRSLAKNAAAGRISEQNAVERACCMLASRRLAVFCGGCT